VRAYFHPPRQTGEGELIAEGSERACRRAAARALGRPNLRGCLTAPSEQGIFYFEPAVGWEDAKAVELTTGRPRERTDYLSFDK
jgi:hypothetical protein